MMVTDRNPLVSIITPSFNSGDFLEKAIRSVIAQDYPHVEHIIVDGGSTDNTLEILQRYNAPVTWVSELDEGQADAINKGFQRANGEVIGWLNADDTYQPGAIASAVAYLQSHSEIDLVYGNYNFINARGEVIHTYLTPEFSLDRLLSGDAIIPQTSMFLRKHIIDAIGGVDPMLHYVMDWEFTLRIARRYRIKRVAEMWGNFRIVEGTKSVQQPERFWPEIIAVLQEVIQVEPERYKTIATEALFRGHLLAALEFARSKQASSARLYTKRAFDLNPEPEKHPAIVASGLFKAATYPWHSAFKPHPQAQQALDQLSLCLSDSVVGRRILGYLSLYRALRSFRQGRWQDIAAYLSQTTSLLTRRDLMDWRSARMVLGAIFR